MEKAVKVAFSENGQTYLFNINTSLPEKNDKVIVETERGKFLGYVKSNILDIDEKLLEKPLKKIIKIASNKEYKIFLKNMSESKLVLKKSRDLAKKLKVKINPTQAEYTIEKDKLIIYFVSDSRVDFRELARALAAEYRTRIELRQVGVRDKAKEVGGLGSCGRTLCCKLYLKNFDSVSISMAKNQSIALNPNKINGACGRLLCCLRYENENYSENKKRLPKCGARKKTNNEEVVVVEINPLSGKYKVQTTNKEIIEKDIYESN